MSDQEVEQAFEDLEGAFADLLQALGREFALGGIVVVGQALRIVRSARQEYGRYREFEKQLSQADGLALVDKLALSDKLR